jgi:hypothetical protein
VEGLIIIRELECEQTLEPNRSHGRVVGGEIRQSGIQGEKQEGTGGDSI